MFNKLTWVLFLLLTTTVMAEERVPLGSLDITKMSYGAVGEVTRNHNLNGTPIRLGGKEYAEGVCTHAFSDMKIAVNGAVRFMAEVGIDSKFPNSGSVQFKIYGDNKLLWRSSLKRGGEPADKADISVKGYDILELAVTDGGDDYTCDWADWADAAFIVEGKHPVALDLPPFELRKSQTGSVQEEQEIAALWIRDHLLDNPAPLCSFQYGDRALDQIVKSWKRTVSSRELENGKTEHVIVFADEQSHLELRCEAVVYSDYPAVEWTFWLKNTGSDPTPVISDLQAIDTTFFADRFHPNTPVILHHFKGDYCTPDSYEPKEFRFTDKNELMLSSSGGRPTNVEFPYYRIQGPHEGLFFVVSWQGQWETTFKAENGIRVRSGQQQVHARLMPDEEIRTPMIFCMFYNGNDQDRIVNLWRRWFLTHNTPNVDGHRIPPVYAIFTGHQPISDVNENDTDKDLIRYTDRFFDQGVPFDYYWLDAGWYPCQVPGQEHNAWPYVGTWKFDPKRFPHGLRPTSDHIRGKGAKVLVWFEPERVTPGSELAVEHPDWILGGSLLNLGNPDARNWITKRILTLLEDEGIDWYRQDYNIDPLGFWRRADAPDRQGMTENLYCRGYLKFWDDLLANKPGLIIDSCASGGRRNDLETLRRSLPIHVTDFNYGDLTVKQAMHHTLFQWFPYFGGVNWPADQSGIYYHRTNYSLLYLGNDRGILHYHGDERGQFNEQHDFAKMKRWMDEWREIAPLLYADYYPLLPYSRNDRDWCGWQFNDPETGEGMVQLFKRPQAIFLSGRFRLKGLESETEYEIKNYDTGEIVRKTGKDLMENGLLVDLKESPDSALFKYGKR